jgi:hypothetical protein
MTICNIIRNSSVLFLLYFRKGTFRNASDRETSSITLIDSISTEHLSELNKDASQLYQATSTYASIHQDITSDCNVDDCLFSFEEILDILPPITDNIASTYQQADENIDTVSIDEESDS